MSAAASIASHPHAAPATTRPEPRYRIADVAKRVGVSPSALRDWERQGLVTPARTRAGYRLYSDEDVHQLGTVRRMRQEDRVNAPGIRRILGVGSSGTERSRQAGRLRDLRRRSGLSLRQASEKAGLSVSFVSALERGTSGASIAALQRLLAAYDATTLDLLGPSRPLPGRRARAVRAGRARTLELPGSLVRIEQLATTAELLEPQLFTLAAGATSEGSYSHGGEEFLFVLCGAITVWIGEGERYRLGEGDSLVFSSTLPHRWRNEASGETRLLWINTPPTF
ncbi:MAG: MerR family transcriptional regulator [Candidatus Limnocylindria bacterium]